jgi:hypothetical protein
MELGLNVVSFPNHFCLGDEPQALLWQGEGNNDAIDLKIDDLPSPSVINPEKSSTADTAHCRFTLFEYFKVRRENALSVTTQKKRIFVICLVNDVVS